MSYSEVRIAGFGGQGIVLAGQIMAGAACIHEDKYATMVRSFGPEARGGTCSAQIIISSERIAYPYVTRPNLLVALSQQACDKFAPSVRPDTLPEETSRPVRRITRAPGTSIHAVAPRIPHRTSRPPSGEKQARVQGS